MNKSPAPKKSSPASQGKKSKPAQNQSESKKADKIARKGDPLPAATPAERSPKQENL
jgi:hypothetical protein